MRRIQVLCRLVLLVIVVFGLVNINQIYYIIVAVTILTKTTDFKLPIAYSITDTKPINTSNCRFIPRIVHQLWKSKNVSNYPIKASDTYWKDSPLYKNYTVKLWTDDELNELIRLKYPFLYKTYQSYKIPIQRADIARLAVLHSEGGIYADLDVYPSMISTNELCNYRFVAPRANNFHLITNHFLMAERKSTLVEYLLIKSVERAKVSIWIPYLHVFWTTGPIFITKMVYEYCQLNPNYDGLILDDGFMNEFARHDAGRSWHQKDGQFLNYVADHSEIIKKFIFGLLPFVFFSVIYALYHQLRARRISNGSIL